MPRPPRLVVPGTPLHITHRGVDRGPTFLTAEDFAVYLWALRAASLDCRCAVHAYVLMTNHVHLLLTPPDASAPARLMVKLGRRYVRYFNHRYRRTGTLWEGRYRSAVVRTNDYFFACSRYIERNPQRAGLVSDPADYAWSSFRRNACGDPDALITPHPLYVALGEDECARSQAYRQLFDTEPSPSVVTDIHTAPLLRPVLPPTTYQQATAIAGATVSASARWLLRR